MSKLFKLKEWVTVPDAARHLSIVFGEDVTEADVLRLALDGHLKLSVNFVNHARGRCGKVVPWKDTEWWILPRLNMKGVSKPPDSPKTTPPEKFREPPPKFLEVLNEISEDEKDDFSVCMRSLNIDDERFINLEKDVTTIKGVWDLPMIGCEKLDIEHEYQQLTGGPAVTLQNLEGAFVEARNGQMCQLQESFDNNEYEGGSKAQLEKLKQFIADDNIGAAEAEELLDQHKKKRKDFLKRRDAQSDKNNYYPAGSLPADSVLVIRTDALREFEESINDAPENVEKPMTTTERNTLLTIIAALCDYSAIIPAERGAASQIAKLSEEIGAPVTDDTIRKILAKIPDALESRKK